MECLLLCCMFIGIMVNVNSCSDGYYGFGAGCNKLCSERNCKGVNSTCDQINGTCENGCYEGFRGLDCSLETASISGDNSQTTTISLTVAVVLLVAIAVISFIIWRRRRSLRPDKDGEIRGAIKRNKKTDGNMYENFEVMQRNDETMTATSTLRSAPPLEADDDNVDGQAAEEVYGDSAEYMNEIESEALHISEVEEDVEKVKDTGIPL